MSRRFAFRPLKCIIDRLMMGHSVVRDRRKVVMEVMQHSTAFLLPPISSEPEGSSLRYALVVLNQPVPRFTPLLWNHSAQLRVFADGGANRVYDELPRLFPHEDALDIRRRYKPDVIKGDMDSIRSEVLDFYTGLGCKVIDKSHDQETTDLHKCVSYIKDFTRESEKSNVCILVAGALGGRFDHEAGNINVLYRFSAMRIILLSNDCLIQVLPRTHDHKIHIESSVVGPHCGLVPIGMPSSRTTTTGLKWNLTARMFELHLTSYVLCFQKYLADTEMKFGGLVSTSNIVSGDTVTVQSDSDLLWTISIKNLSDYGLNSI